MTCILRPYAEYLHISQVWEEFELIVVPRDLNCEFGFNYENDKYIEPFT